MTEKLLTGTLSLNTTNQNQHRCPPTISVALCVTSSTACCSDIQFATKKNLYFYHLKSICELCLSPRPVVSEHTLLNHKKISYYELDINSVWFRTDFLILVRILHFRIKCSSVSGSSSQSKHVAESLFKLLNNDCFDCRTYISVSILQQVSQFLSMGLYAISAYDVQFR